MSVVKRLVIVIGIFSILTTAITAQNPKKAQTWYFGEEAGLDFSQGRPVAITTGSLEALEGISTLSDNTGNLMFYTNGGEYPFTGAVWNKNHQVMPNGFLVGSGGCNSSLQSSLIVPKSGSTNIFYMFTTDCYENNFSGGLSYSVIDMNLDGGLGDVVLKGIKLADNANESLAGVKHANDKDYWVITHIVNTDSFYAFHINRDGIAGVVKSKIGPIAGDFAGEIKVSPNGEKLVFAGLDFTALFDFNANTGVLSKYKNLGVSSYTASFSPNCQYLYVTKFQDKKIYQFDVHSYNTASTKITIGFTSRNVGSLQIGPDKKIYVALNNYGYVGVINRPDIKGTNCDYQNQGVHLAGKICRVGLPNFTNDILGECLPYPIENVTQYDLNLRLKQISVNKIDLFWDNNSSANQYRISVRQAEETEWQTYATNGNTFTAENLENNTDYQFRIDAIIMEKGTYEVIHNHYFEDLTSENNLVTQKKSLTLKTKNKLSFEIYPNPARKKAQLNIDLGDINTFFELHIYSVSGQLVFKQRWESISGQNSFDIPLINLETGVYSLSMKTENMSENERLIVMN